MGGLSVEAAARYHSGIDVKQAAVGVQQCLLIGNELVANFNVALANDLLSGRGPQCRDRCCQNSRGQKNSDSPIHSF